MMSYHYNISLILLAKRLVHDKGCAFNWCCQKEYDHLKCPALQKHSLRLNLRLGSEVIAERGCVFPEFTTKEYSLQTEYSQ